MQCVANGDVTHRVYVRKGSEIRLASIGGKRSDSRILRIKSEVARTPKTGEWEQRLNDLKAAETVG